jgi:peptide-methionine (S)-S-oxide reductase
LGIGSKGREDIKASIRLIFSAIAASCCAAARRGDSARARLASEPIAEKGAAAMQKATFAAGCFWGVEAAFRQVKGVKETAVGYEGGATENPTYQDVCSNSTGHAEVVQVTYDPGQVTYEQLLDVYWASHDPTTLNRQGPDVGTQYRSAIFFHTPEQEAAATASRNALEEKRAFKRPIVTEIVPAATFYLAEEYHQRYLEKRGLSQCHI